ncbi:MAG TPA: hypothetical protein DCL35_03225 [Candidatus Omnitrophica bacterium]|nr:hypothetical protein [Candidatus Omnitrophota bacterium]
MKISAVIVTFNSCSLIAECLDSVMSQPYADKEAIVVDNGSSDGTADLIKSYYPQIRVICNASNEGAAGARNQGIKAASGDWIVTLDADTRLSNDFFFCFEDFIKSGRNGRVGIVAPKILYQDRRTIYSLGNELTPLRRFYDIGKGRRDSGRYKGIKKVFGACSAAAFYNREMLEDIKVDGAYLDPRFFFMAEDVDVAWRARKKGWGVLSCYGCVAYHDGDSSRTHRKARNFYSIRNRLLMVFKNDDPLYIFLWLWPLVIFELLRFFFLLAKGSASVYVAALLSASRIIRGGRGTSGRGYEKIETCPF